MTNPVFWLVPISAIVALFLAWYFYRQMMKESEGTDTMKRIASHVRKGAMSYLKQQYKIVGIVFLCLVVLFSIMAYGFQLQNPWVPVAFLTGGFFSGLSGFLGMKTATYASARTANAARNSLNAGLRVAFRSGAVMGLVVVGLGLIDISFWYLLLDWLVDLPGTAKLAMITTTMLTFGMGASTQALFARVGGGIYTKAADVGADLVGKVEAGIPEDDPRNPATIADNVGDNVGDVAGMGADLYESYCGSILATSALGAAAYLLEGDTVMQYKAVIAPMLIAAVGILLSIIGIFSVRTKEDASMKNLLGALSLGTNLSSVLIVAATFLILWLLGINNWWMIGCSVVTGLIVGIVIGRSTEYYTSQSYKPTKKLAESGTTGPATVIRCRPRYGFHRHSRYRCCGRYHPQLLVRFGLRLQQRCYGSLRHRYRCRRHAVDPRHHTRHRRIRPYRRQCRRQRRNERPRRRSATPHRRPRLPRQHHRRHRQRLRHRFGCPYRPCPACIVHRRNPHRSGTPRRNYNTAWRPRS